MADHCGFCKTRRPQGGTNILILGAEYLEFCGPCGDIASLTNKETGEVKTVREAFDACQENKPVENGKQKTNKKEHEQDSPSL